MSVFTFMGDTILKQDDAYSFHIISRILETVIPALVTVSTIILLKLSNPVFFKGIFQMSQTLFSKFKPVG